MSSALDLVRSFYPALANGDVSGLLALLHTDLKWTEAEGFSYYSGTWRKPDDIAAAIAFIVSPAARWMTGAALRVDGGETKTI